MKEENLIVMDVIVRGNFGNLKKSKNNEKIKTYESDKIDKGEIKQRRKSYVKSNLRIYRHAIIY
jgi:hypothetical protein